MLRNNREKQGGEGASETERQERKYESETESTVSSIFFSLLSLFFCPALAPSPPFLLVTTRLPLSSFLSSCGCSVFLRLARAVLLPYANSCIYAFSHIRAASSFVLDEIARYAFAIRATME